MAEINLTQGEADAIHHNNEQSFTLATIRDALLPKLLSGEIKVDFAQNLQKG